MCTTVVMPDGEWVTSIGRLAQLGWEPHPEDFDESEMVDGIDVSDLGAHCLCNVDVEAVLNRYGVDFNEGTPGFLDVTA